MKKASRLLLIPVLVIAVSYIIFLCYNLELGPFEIVTHKYVDGEYIEVFTTPIADRMQTEENIFDTIEATIFESVKTISNGDVYVAKKYEFTGNGAENVKLSIEIDGTHTVIDYFDQDTKKLVRVEDFDDIPIEPLFIKTLDTYMILYPGFSYENVGSASLVDGSQYAKPVTIVEKSKSTVIEVLFENIGGYEGHIWWITSNEELVDFSNATYELAWLGYTMTEKQRWAYDGYYYETPSTYYPYKEGMFWRNPAAYMQSSMVKMIGCRANYSLSYAMLDTLMNNMEDGGYYKTYPESAGFLFDDYGMTSEFYDTRFNTEINRDYFHAYENTGDPRFLKIALEMMDFFMYFAENYNFEFIVDGQSGILVEDYYHEDSNYQKTHSSLNHHLAEINLLYIAYEHTLDQEYLDMADRMLRGIHFTKDLWVMDDHSLEYAYMPDGTMGLIDYPYLTYNDLYEVQETREYLGFERDEVLDYLMSEKYIHMENNGIKGYKGYVSPWNR